MSRGGPQCTSLSKFKRIYYRNIKKRGPALFNRDYDFQSRLRSFQSRLRFSDLLFNRDYDFSIAIEIISIAMENIPIAIANISITIENISITIEKVSITIEIFQSRFNRD